MGAEHHWEITGTIHVFYCQNSPRFFSSLSKYFTNYFSLLKTRTNKRWLSTGTSKSPFTASSVHGLKNTNFCYLHASFFLLLLFKILKQPFFKGAECYVATADLYMEKKNGCIFHLQSGYFYFVYIHGFALTGLRARRKGGQTWVISSSVSQCYCSVYCSFGTVDPVLLAEQPGHFDFSFLNSCTLFWIVESVFFSRDTETFKRKYHRTRITLDRLITRNKLWFILKALATFFLINQSFKSG